MTRTEVVAAQQSEDATVPAPYNYTHRRPVRTRTGDQPSPGLRRPVVQRTIEAVILRRPTVARTGEIRLPDED